jgi:hypothetical protein
MTSDLVQQITVLYLAGAARVGMTILDNVLGAIDGYFSIGELRFLWTRVLQHRRCGCGLLLADCPIWSAVLAASLKAPGLSSARPEAVVQLQHRVSRLHHTPGLLRRDPAGGRSALTTLVSVYEIVYRTLAQVSGSRVIIDSSGRASEGALLRLVSNVQPCYVHMVRDPRACVYSQAHPKVNPDGDIDGQFESVRPALSCLYWDANNLAADALCRHEDARSMRLRYEDFVAQPGDSVQRIRSMINEPPGESPFVGERFIDLGMNHTVSGNPSRFVRGRTAVELDERWTTLLSVRDRRVTTALTWPLMMRYGYPLTARTPHRQN